jgi:ATP-dependent Clp protease ATP-binding subunit ClpA
MNIEKLTIKAQEALQDGQRLAAEYGHPEVETEHLLLSLIRQKEGVVPPLLGKLGVHAAQFEQELENALSRRPRVQGAAAMPGISRGLGKVLNSAFDIARDMRDEYVSTEHLFLAAIQDGGRDVGEIARRLGLKHEAVLQALQAVRGDQRVTDQNPEDKYEALKRYGRDLT